MAQANLIIVDDERLNADGVRMLIANSGLAVNIVGVFYSSTKALAFLEDNVVDIVVTDIKMPKITGLELIKQIKALNPDVEIIVFTGYGSLAYAQEAMQYGVKYFLEKPVLPNKLAASIAGSLKSYQRHLQTSRLRQKQLIENVLLGDADLINSEIDPFILVSLENNQFEHIHEVLEHSFERGECNYIRVAHRDEVLYCVFGRAHLKAPMAQIEQTQRGQHLVIAVQTDVSLTNLRQMATQNQQVLALAAYVNKPTMLTDVVPPALMKQRELMGEWGKRLKLNLRDPKAALEAFDQICDEALTEAVAPQRLITAMYSTVINELPAEKRSDFQHTCPQEDTVDSLRNTVIQAVSLIVETEEEAQGSGDIVANLDQIIATHYGESTLSLKWVANHLLYLNPEYLGKRYSQRTGKKFSQALTEARMVHAADLLLRGYKVIEVARLVGYENNPDYFGQQFKKYYAQTPYRYQRDHMGK